MVKMTAVEYPLQDSYTVRRNVLYTSSLDSSATATVFSDASSQIARFSDNSTSTSFSDLNSNSYSLADGSLSSCQQVLTKTQLAAPEVNRSLRQNPRRTSTTATTRTGCPPPLVRQAERKLNFVDNLVGRWR